MLKRCGIITVLLFSLMGCHTPTQRDIEDAKDRVKLIELEAQIQRLEAEMCVSISRHVSSCRGKCTISRTAATPTTTVTTINKIGKGSSKKAPLSIYSPR